VHNDTDGAGDNPYDRYMISTSLVVLHRVVNGQSPLRG